MMKTVSTYLRSFARSHTYDVRRNAYLWFGFLWGLPVPVFAIAFDLTLSGMGGKSPFDAVAQHPIHLFFLAHPALFATIFGAMGTIRHDLEQENRRLVASLTDQAMTDSLTGLYNRRYVMEELKNMLLRAKRSGQPVSVVLFDIDRFKAINDLQGHEAGDRALQRVAAALRSVLRQGDTLARYGGDEFLLVVQGDLPCAMGLVGRASDAVRQTSGLSISAGVARYPENGTAPEDLIRAADLLMSEAKKKHHEERVPVCR